eukprot:jgi/Tetstr1/455271/TSEL_042109.t1
MKAYKHLPRGTYKEDFGPPLELAEAAPYAPISRRTAFDAASIKKASKLPGVAGVILLMRTFEQHDDNAPPAHSHCAEALAARIKEVEDYLKLPQVSPSMMMEQTLIRWLASAGVERLFSAAGRMHNDFKKSTSDTIVEHSLLLYKNLE